MENKTDNILLIDDEQSILNALKRLLRKEGYNLFFGNSGKEGLEIIKNNKDIKMVISDQRMPEMSGTEFLAKVKQTYPDIMRIILTGYSDVESITESINKGNIYKFFFKPWNDHSLKVEIKQALEQYNLIQANKQLDETVATQNQELQTMNENLEKLVEERTEELKLHNHMLQISHAILEDLPISVMGIDDQGIIVIFNKMAHNIVNTKNKMKIGTPLSDYFPKEVTAGVDQVFKNGEPVDIDSATVGCGDHKAKLMPLSGPFRGRGVIMVLFSK